IVDSSLSYNDKQLLRQWRMRILLYKNFHCFRVFQHRLFPEDAFTQFMKSALIFFRQSFQDFHHLFNLSKRHTVKQYHLKAGGLFKNAKPFWMALEKSKQLAYLFLLHRNKVGSAGGLIPSNPIS